MPSGHLNFYRPQSLSQSLNLNISNKFHVFPGGRISGQNIDIRAQNITIEVAGSLVTESNGFTKGSGTGELVTSFCRYCLLMTLLGVRC